QVHAQRYGPATVVATALSLAGWQAQPDRVSLDWYASDDAVRSARVERRDAVDAAWRTIASGEFDDERHLRVEDATVKPGVRYAYRLAYPVAATERFTAETWIDVPSAHVFALHGARPNPASSSELTVAFSLRTNAPALLELFDVNGRRVSGRNVGSMGPGAHTLRWAEGERVRAGLYWLRLHQGTDSAMSRVVVID
ncbi:MAG: T9SS type A sorting domain-containing protein, partial [Candidatus Eisenbacteria bacterium]